MGKFLLVILLFAATLSFSQADQQRKEIFFLGSDWKLSIDLSGFSVEYSTYLESENNLELFATNADSGISVSVFFEKAHSNGDSKACRDYYLKKLNKSSVSQSEKKQYDKNNFAVNEYVAANIEGVKLNQKNINFYRSVDGTWIDIHVSKTNYSKDDEKNINAFISTLAIVQKTSFDFFSYATYLFQNEKYSTSILFYERALALEKKQRSLARDMFYVLIDNLGMAYGISGDYENCEKTLSYGISIDQTYPLFYYNLACCYAETGDSEKLFINLENALKYKSNMIAKEQFPDPAKDSSFKKYSLSPQFKELLKKYK